MNTRKAMLSCLFSRCLLGSLLVLALAGCASKGYVALLPDQDGRVGQVLVSNAKGQTLLDSKSQAAELDTAPGKTFVLSDEQLRKDFGAAMAAAPQAPVSYLLYFETGGATLTPESQGLIPQILAEIQRRPGADVSVVGHSDTQGDDNANFQLALSRAQTVAQSISTAQLSADRISVESHGEKNLLIPTADDVPEPRNRRVEILVR